MRTKVALSEVLLETLNRLDGDGILLVAGDPPNPMTIGWSTIGHIWNKDVMNVLVRPVRYTFQFMESEEDFSVCVLPDRYRKELNLCGTRSGRDINKLEVCNLHVEKCSNVNSFFISESTIHFECRIVHKHFLDPATLDPAIIKRYYPQKDYHMVYYGEIVGIFRN
ncbi:MAG TPA: flavin reductase [Bacteroidales bacterium]|nr:flavin reductase [Bacteroidales bacterium]HRZ20243.1 flavin reductase [Bacteroidales bacterium]